MDFMSDTLYHGRRLRILNILDEGVREAEEYRLPCSDGRSKTLKTLLLDHVIDGEAYDFR